MGKYQLDPKGQQIEQKFHEKNSTDGGKGINTKNATQAKIAELRKKMAQKTGKHIFCSFLSLL